MRALVAEANVVTRVMLTRILERRGYAVDELRDELAATCLLYQPEAPELALLALDTLLVDFEQICRAMREAKPSVFITALVPETRRQEVGIVLDAGADDFLIKPSTVQEAEARIRVIGRMLEARLGTAPVPTEETDEAATPAHSHEPQLARLLADFDFTHALAGVFEPLGFGPIRSLGLDIETPPPHYAGWVPLLLHGPKHVYWLNVRIDFAGDAARRFFQTAHPGTGFNDVAFLTLLAEIMSLVQDGLRVATIQYEGVRTYLPVAPMAILADDLPAPSALASKYAQLRHFNLALADDLRLQLSLTMEPTPVESRRITNLHPFDVLAQDIQSAEYQTMLLRAGTLLNGPYIDKIMAFIHSQNLSQEVRILQPPQGTVSFLRKRL